MEETVLVATETLTPLKEAADVLQLSATWLRGEALAGRVPCLKAGKEVLFNLPALRRVLYARAGTEFLPPHEQTAKLYDERKYRPVIVCLCGSTRFKDAYTEANKTETLAGKVVLSVGLLGHHEGLDMNGPVKQMLDTLHLFKVELADEVLILNVGGYIGESTRRELEHAKKLGKTVRYLEAVQP